MPKKAKVEAWVFIFFVMATCMFVLPAAINFFPLIGAVSLLLPAGLILDFDLTFRIFKTSRRSFERCEYNFVFKHAVQKTSFQCAVCVFLAVVELPVFFVIAFLIIPNVPGAADAGTWAYISAAAAMLGSGHISAWTENRGFYRNLLLMRKRSRRKQKRSIFHTFEKGKRGRLD